jgi:hypothetical protein
MPNNLSGKQKTASHTFGARTPNRANPKEYAPSRPRDRQALPEDPGRGYRCGGQNPANSTYAETGHEPYIDSDRSLELPALRKDGSEIYVEMSLSPIGPVDDTDGDEHFVLAIVRDITNRKPKKRSGGLPRTSKNELRSAPGNWRLPSQGWRRGSEGLGRVRSGTGALLNRARRASGASSSRSRSQQICRPTSR